MTESGTHKKMSKQQFAGVMLISAVVLILGGVLFQMGGNIPGILCINLGIVGLALGTARYVFSLPARTRKLPEKAQLSQTPEQLEQPGFSAESRIS